MNRSFIILGTPECTFCNQAKDLIKASKFSYSYIDLTLLYPDDWKQVFKTLATVIEGKTKIPLIFLLTNEDQALVNNFNGEKLLSMISEGKAEFLGGYFELEDWLDTMEEYTVDGNY